MGGVMRRALAAAGLLLAVSLIAVVAQPAGVPVVGAAGAFEPLPAPQRLLDTRPGSATADGQFAGIGVRPAGTTLELPVAGRAGVSPTASSVVLNVTVDAALEDGFVTVHPCDTPRPNASNLNYRIGQTIPNTVVTRVGPGGTVCLYTFGATHLIVDVAGVLATDAFSPLPAPQRLLDTRPGSATADGQFAGIGVRPAGTTLELPVAGRAGVSPTASSVVLNVTVDAALEDGFATVFPCDAPQPNASNLNYVAGITIPNAVVTRIGAAGTVCLFTFGATHLIVDVAGVFSPGSFNPLAAPQRVFDSRPLAATADGLFSGGGVQPRNTTMQLKVAGRVGVPADASAVVLNVTAVNAVDNGFVTVHPRGSPLPNASNLNFVAGQNIPNAVITRVGPGGAVCFFTSGATHLIVDVAGWLTGPPPATTGPNCPSSVPTHSSAEATTALLSRPALHPAVGSDQIGVWVCDVPPDTTNSFYFYYEHVDVDATQVAAWAQTTVAPYFAEVSRGRYTATFTALGHIPLSSTEGPGECREKARTQTGAPYTNVLFTDTRSYFGGQAGPGLISSNPAFDESVLVAGAPDQTRRGAWVGGGSTGPNLSPLVVVHEIGHTLHWPHSYNTSATGEYDNRVDVMSGYPADGLCTGPTSGGFTLWPCEPQHTLAFNRFASGWIDGNQVAIHRSGTVNYTLDAPARDGLQFVALPDPSDPRSMLTLEARPRVGRDQFLGVEGVALHVVDQVPRGGFIDGFSTGRRQRQALGASSSYDHVLGVGASLTVHGVTVTVLGRSGDSYEVAVSGSYRMPASNFFTDDVGTASSCATLDIRAALDRGCLR
jgi:hypothetical protein